MKEVQWLKSTPPSPLRDNSRDSYKRCNRVLHLLSLWFLRRYNSSLWGKLYKSGISLRTLWYRIASTLLTFWHLCGVRADEGDLRNQSVPSEAHKAVFCFMLRCLLPPPNVIMLPTHPITRSSVACAPESKQRRRWQGCMCACLTGVPEVTLAQTLTHTHHCLLTAEEP